LGGQSAAAIIPKADRGFWRTLRACFADITGRLYNGAHWPVVQGVEAAVYFVRRFPSRNRDVASKQKRGSNEARYEIIGLKPFQMALRPRRKDAIMRNG
jgi:hypothetical protein